jgi:integrase
MHAMPRRRSPPRLYLDPGRRQWAIRDGASFVRTGLPEHERAAAERKLAEYLGAKHEPERAPDPLIADVLNIYAQERLPQTRAMRKAAYNALSLLRWWGDKRVSQVTPSNCLSYAANRTPAAARRDLEVLGAALRWWHKHREPLAPLPSLVMPPRAEPRDRWLTRGEAARLLWAARHTEHLKRFVLLGLYTGSRSGVILSLEWSWIDLDRGVMRRRARGQAETSTKRTPPVRLGRKILGFLRRWKQGSEGLVVHYRGQRLRELGSSWVTACARAGLEGVSPHTLRHTRATWLMQQGVDLWQAAGHLGMSPGVLQKTYGHHHPDYQEDAAEV